MDSTSSTSSFVPDMPQYTPRIVGILFHVVVGPHDFRHPRRDDFDIRSTWEFAWVEMIVDDDWDTTIAFRNNLYRVDQILIWETAIQAFWLLTCMIINGTFRVQSITNRRRPRDVKMSGPDNRYLALSISRRRTVIDIQLQDLKIYLK